MAKKAIIRLIFTFLISILLIWIGISSINNISIKQYEEDELAKKEAAVDVFFDQQFFNLSILTRAHAYWTDAKVAMDTNDIAWIEENLTEYLLDGNYDVDFVYVTDEANLYPIFSGIDPFEISDTSIYKETLNNNNVSQSFIELDDVIYMVTAFPFANDDETDKTGLMLIARAINTKYNQDLQAIIGDVGDDHLFITTNNDFSTFHDENLTIFAYPSIDETLYIGSHLTFAYTNFLSNTIRMNTIAIVFFTYFVIAIVLISIGLQFKKEVDHTLFKLDEIDISTGKFKHITHSKAKKLNDVIDTINYLGSEVESNIQELINKNLEVVELLSMATEMKDPYTQTHGENVSEIAAGIGKLLNYQYMKDLEYSAKFHDIGKVFLHYDILNKKGPLTKEEYDQVKQHPIHGATLLSTIKQFDRVRLGVLYHHERYDGTGYPKGLKGEKIPLIARILIVADVYEALTSDRPYRNAFSKTEALIIMEEGRNKLFDPNILDAFFSYHNHKEDVKK